MTKEIHRFRTKDFPRQTGRCLIYFLTDGDQIKIGFSSGDLKKRIVGLQTGNPRLLRILALIEIPNRKVPNKRWKRSGDPIEENIHDHFEQFRGLGEWFKLSTTGEDWLPFLEEQFERI